MIGLAVGGGIFLTPSIDREGGSERDLDPGRSGSSAGLLAIAGGLVYAEMGAMMPQAGGMYVFFREAFGELPAFLYAWVAFWVILIGSDAAVAIGFAQYFSVFFPSLSNAHVVATLGPFPINAAQLVAVGLVVVLSATHYVGVREGARIQGIFTSMILLALLWIAVGGAFASAPAAAAGRRRPGGGADACRHSAPPSSRSSGPTTAGTRSWRSRARSPIPAATSPSPSFSERGS